MTKPKWYDLTMPRGQHIQSTGMLNPYYGMTMTEIGKSLEEHGAERYVVGEETGDAGYEHWQIRVVFKKGHDKSEVIGWYPQVHVSETHEHNFDYVEKEGKFYRSWEKALKKYQEMKLWTWQYEVLEKVRNLKRKGDDRKIIVIVDTEGNSGKTTLAKHLTATHQGAYCPPMPEALDYMAWALAHSQAGTFLIDLPRADTEKRNKAMWSAVEQMKNGYLYDKRNQWREKWIEPPQVIVFTNEEPDLSLLSSDRWMIGEWNKYSGLPKELDCLEWRGVQ